jgi:hypothetical protein
MRPMDQRERNRFRISDRRRRKAKSQKLVQSKRRQGPTRGLEPAWVRGYEQEIGPGHQRSGRHEPSSCTSDKGHKCYKHWDRIWAICPLQENKCTTHGAALVIEGTRKRQGRRAHTKTARQEGTKTTRQEGTRAEKRTSRIYL